jgi:hypothetical protein
VLSAADTLVMVWFDLVFASHVKLHTTANWAVNPQSSDACVRRMGVVTVMYNYFGHTVFPTLGRFFFNAGLLPADGAAVKDVIAAGVAGGVRSHLQVGGVLWWPGFAPACPFCTGMRAGGKVADTQWRAGAWGFRSASWRPLRARASSC